jgi:hypothetical protein
LPGAQRRFFFVEVAHSTTVTTILAAIGFPIVKDLTSARTVGLVVNWDWLQQSKRRGTKSTPLPDMALPKFARLVGFREDAYQAVAC